MEFGKIEKKSGEIELNEWNKIIESHSSLEKALDRKGTNPFTNEEITFSGKGVAFYIEGGNPEGNIALQEGSLLTTGVPLNICNDIASILGASVNEDDRS
ncbi:hypothetical protein [Kangiella sp. M94]